MTFHDGSPLTAEVVKNDLDAYRGQYDGRSPLLFLFVLDNIDAVEVTGDLEVTVTTKVPWVALPALLHSSGRLGIMAQAQLDDADSCDRDLIGTGPFQLESWEVDRELVATKYPDYWQNAPDGEPYPYLDEIRFTPIIEAEQRDNSSTSEPDPEVRSGIYEGINRRFGSEVYSLWANWTTWRVSSGPDVHGYTLETLPELPDGSDPFTGLATGHPTQGLWVEQ